MSGFLLFLLAYLDQTIVDGKKEEFSLKTETGATLVGEMFVPDGEGLKPAVILIHAGTSNHKEWELISWKLMHHGYLVLAFDLRGHGESSSMPPGLNIFTDPTVAPEDLKEVLNYVRKEKRVNPDRIAVMGASIGGNLACVASSAYGIKTAVAISSKTDAVYSLAGTDDLGMHSVFHISSESDQRGARATWAKELFEKTAEPRKVAVVPGSEHGVAILTKNGKLLLDVLAWFETNL